VKYWYGVFFLLLTFAFSQQKLVVGYYPAWESSYFPAAKIKYNNLTHINHAFAYPDAQGNLKVSAGEKIPDADLITSAHAANVKVLLSLGGAGASGSFPAMTADSSARTKFVGNIVNFLETNNYDGVDIDWEGPSSTAEKNNMTLLVKTIHDSFQKNHAEWLITMAVGPTSWSGQWLDYASLKQNVNWFNIMTYDFHGSWSHCGHNSPLYSPSPLLCTDGSVDYSVSYLNVTRGIPKSQMIIGLPFYGYLFKCAANQYGLYKPIQSAEQLLYGDIVSRMGNATRVWDDVTHNAYLTFTPPDLISYDDSMSISLKCNYVKDKDLGGVMMWALGEDVVSNGSQPLMDAVGAAMFTVTDVYPSRSVPSPSEFSLSNNYPNPFNPSTTINFTIPYSASGTSHVRLNIYNILGEKIAALVNDDRSPGNYTVRWKADNVSAGVYFYSLEAGGSRVTKQMSLIK
jgi:chitinase